jgi:hypothetical protein
MIFGSQSTFAVEVAREPDGDFGRDVTGRIRVFLGGFPVGDFSESGCALGPLSDHLLELASRSGAMWHPSLESLTPREQFELLDSALFIGDVEEVPAEYHLTGFLTNVSEAFDGIKAFLISPESDRFVALVQEFESGTFVSQSIAHTEFAGVADQFARWVKEERHAKYGNGAV